MNDGERLDRAIEKLLADESPRSELPDLNDEEQRMVRMAQLLHGSRPPAPAPEFVERLEQKIFPRPARVSRRAAFLSGLGALAAGLVAGVGIDRVAQEQPRTAEEQLIGPHGKWLPVAQIADVPDGTVMPFTAGAVQGFLIHRNGQVRALSRVCTHMGCTLRFESSDGSFACPCHGAEFDLQGRLRRGPHYYKEPLPPLPKIDVRVRDGSVEVRTV